MNLFKTSRFKKKKNTRLLRLPDVSALSAVRKEYQNVSPPKKSQTLAFCRMFQHSISSCRFASEYSARPPMRKKSV